VLVVRIEALPQRRGPAVEARACYQELTAGASGANNSQQSLED